MRKIIGATGLLAGAVVVAHPVQAAMTDGLATAGLGLSLFISLAALGVCVYSVLRVRQLVRDHAVFMRSVEKALSDFSLQAQEQAATVTDLAASARSSVNQLSNRVIERLEKAADLPPQIKPASREGAVQTADSDQSVQSPAVTRSAVQGLEAAIAEGRLTLALEPIVAVARSEAAAFEVYGGLGTDGAKPSFLRRYPGESRNGLAQRFEMEMVRQAARLSRRQFGASGAATPLHVAVSKELLRNDEAVEETGRLFAAQPALCQSLLLSLPVHIFNGASDQYRDALDRLQTKGVRFACEGWRGNHLAMAKLANRSVTVIKLSADRLLDREKLRDNDLTGSELAEAAELAGVQLIATGLRTDEDTVSLIDLGVELMSGPRFSSPRLLRDNADTRFLSA